MSKTATPFRDLVKANDLTTKNFYSGNTFAVTTETKSGDFSFKTNVSGDSAGKKPTSAVVEPKYEWKEHNLAFEGKFSSANSVTAKATFKNVVPGLSVHLQGDRAIVAKKGEETEDKVDQSATAGVTYANDKVHLVTEAKVSVPFNKVNLNAALHAKPVDNASVGLKADWDGEKTKVEGKLIGGTEQLEGALSFTFPEKVVGLGFWHSCSSTHQWATVVSYPTAEGGKPSVTVASNYKFDDNTTLKSKIAATLDTDKSANVFRAGVSLQQKVNDNVTVSVGTDVNLNTWGLGKGGDASSFGVQVAFK